MREHRMGATLRAAAIDVIDQLRGRGPVLLLGGSIEGVALAAACAVLRQEPTSWGALELNRPRAISAGATAFAVEPITVDPGITKAIAEAYPGVEVVTPRTAALVAAA